MGGKEAMSYTPEEIRRNIQKAIDTRKWAMDVAKCPDCKKLFPKQQCPKHQDELKKLKEKYGVT